MTTLITNHTFSNLVLRPPGHRRPGPDAVDEPIYKALGDAMAAENGYASQLGYQLYDTDRDDRGLELLRDRRPRLHVRDRRPIDFHPPFAETVAEWNGTTEDATGGGNREAYYLAQENTADASKHSVITGKAPASAILRLTKSFDTPTSVAGH